jgi:uncharacterized membrane protein YfcA
MTLAQGALVFAGGAGAGFVNSLVGGGSFVSFPVLVLVGVPAVTASATNTFSLWPSGATAWWAYRRELATPTRVLVAFASSSVAGAVLGAVLLMFTSDRQFTTVVPWLLLVATVTFTVGPLLRRAGADAMPLSAPGFVIGIVVQFLISVYGGYFGGGMGIMMLAAWTVLRLGNVHAMNALRSLLSAVINGAAAIAFVATRNVAWPEGLTAMAGASLAGYFGARWLRTQNPAVVRTIVMVIAWVVTGYFFWRLLA